MSPGPPEAGTIKRCDPEQHVKNFVFSVHGRIWPGNPRNGRIWLREPHQRVRRAFLRPGASGELRRPCFRAPENPKVFWGLQKNLSEHHPVEAFAHAVAAGGLQEEKYPFPKFWPGKTPAGFRPASLPLAKSLGLVSSQHPDCDHREGPGRSDRGGSDRLLETKKFKINFSVS